MFDLNFHGRIQQILTFRSPEKHFAKSEQEDRALMKRQQYQINAMPPALLMQDPALYAYVTEHYAPYFGLSVHSMERHKDAVYFA